MDLDDFFILLERTLINGEKYNFEINIIDWGSNVPIKFLVYKIKK